MDKRRKKKIYAGLALVLAALVAIEIFFAQPHHHMLWNEIPGADILLGFGGGWLLIFLGKMVMARLQQREEDYYEKGGEKDA
ncbi:MAG: hypothetical protein HFE73_05060 [Firmicutes bacterium]|nr:hypothetical protein [Bacillota bacterium]